MSFIVGILTFLIVVNCVVLILLVLVQLPKKDAGAGLAFGGGAADALFGAGSGNALTKITKWAAGIFLGLAVVLGSLQVDLHRGNASEFQRQVEQQQMQTPIQTQPPSTPPAASPSTPALPLLSATNAPVAPATDTNPTQK
jgi:preprotein translocase subunit SecG